MGLIMDITVNKKEFIETLNKSLDKLKEDRIVANRRYLAKLQQYLKYVEKCVSSNDLITKNAPYQLSISDHIITEALEALKDHVPDTVTLTSEEYSNIQHSIHTFRSTTGSYLASLAEVSY